MNPTTVHSSEVVGQLVLIEADPIRQRVKHAIAGFLAGYSGTTLEAYRLDPRGWIQWLEAAFLDPFVVARPHRVVRPLVRVRRQGPLHDRAALVDDLRVLPLLLSGTPDRA